MAAEKFHVADLGQAVVLGMQGLVGGLHFGENPYHVGHVVGVGDVVVAGVEPQGGQGDVVVIMAVYRFAKCSFDVALAVAPLTPL